ncbi:MAG: hypothetical protein M3N12_10240 [Verrucomicrobiota bacterium]|nr:hypothetical protein [Verrucomicrobiota bacterium]
MKVAVALLITLSGIAAAFGDTDPARDYLSNFSPLDRDKKVYSSDTLLRLELDLDGDGQYEVLLSMARDQDGKGGNVWVVYANTPMGYTRAKGVPVTFNPKSFYLGPIEDVGDYGLVTFNSMGDGGGILLAYLFADLVIREVEVASVTRDAPTVDPESGQLRGQALVDKYMRQAAVATDAVISTNAGILAKQFGLKVAGDPPPKSIPFPSTSRPASGASPEPDQSASPNAQTEVSQSLPWRLLIGILFLALVAIGGVAWAKRR